MSDFNLEDMKEYIEERVGANALYNTKDVLFGCLYYYERVNRNIDISLSLEQLETILNSSNMYNSESILNELDKKYSLEYANLVEGSAQLADIICKVANIAGAFKDLYDTCNEYIDEGNSTERGAECLSEMFKFTATLFDAGSGGLVTTIISEQLRLGAFLLSKGTELAKEYNKRFDELEEVWEEIEKDEKQIDTDLQTKINDAITNSSKECEFYDTIKWYDAIMQEYGWIFSMIESEDSKELQAQYKEISTMLGKRENFMEHYQNVFKYANTQNYLGESNTNDYTTIKDEQKKDLGDAKNATPPADPIILDLNKDGTYSGSLEDGVHFDYDGDGFAEKTAWAAQGDGILVRDINGNGIIDNGSELFGDKTMLSDGTTATGGLQALSDLDTNGDGILNSEVINMFDAKMQESDTDAMRLFEAYVTFLQGNRYTSSIYQKSA